MIHSCETTITPTLLYSLGDLVVYINPYPDDRDEFTPLPGTIGQVTGLSTYNDELYLVQWPENSTLIPQYDEWWVDEISLALLYKPHPYFYLYDEEEVPYNE